MHSAETTLPLKQKNLQSSNCWHKTDLKKEQN